MNVSAQKAAATSLFNSEGIGSGYPQVTLRLPSGPRTRSSAELVAMAVLVLPTSPFVERQLVALRAAVPNERIFTDPASAPPDEIEAILAFRMAPGIAPRFPALRFIACAGAGADDLLATPDLPVHVPVSRAIDPQQGARVAPPPARRPRDQRVARPRAARSGSCRGDRRGAHRRRDARRVRDGTAAGGQPVVATSQNPLHAARRRRTAARSCGCALRGKPPSRPQRSAARQPGRPRPRLLTRRIRYTSDISALVLDHGHDRPHAFARNVAPLDRCVAA